MCSEPNVRVAAWLMERGARVNVVAEALSQELSSQQMGLLKLLLATLSKTQAEVVRTRREKKDIRVRLLVA